MASNTAVRVVVHPTRKGWSWTQVGRNGSAAAVAPKTYDNKANAKRAGARQVATLNRDGDTRIVPTFPPNPYAVLEVVDRDPGYV